MTCSLKWNFAIWRWNVTKNRKIFKTMHHPSTNNLDKDRCTYWKYIKQMYHFLWFTIRQIQCRYIFNKSAIHWPYFAPPPSFLQQSGFWIRMWCMLNEILMHNKRLLHFPYIKKYSYFSYQYSFQKLNLFATNFQAVEKQKVSKRFH